MIVSVFINGNGWLWQLGAFDPVRALTVLAGAGIHWRRKYYGWEIAKVNGSMQYTIFHGSQRETWILQPPVRAIGHGW
jgi:hypothetical protein